MTKLDLQYDLLNYTPASASPVEANLDRIEQHVNQEVLERDGTVAMRAQLRLVGDPLNNLDAAPKQYVDQILPVGIIMMYGGVSTPPGGRWAVCNGVELESSVYPELYAVIGRSFTVVATPAGRFNLPYLIDRFPRGGVPVGQVGGSSEAGVASHSHSMNHTHPASTTATASANHTHAVSGQTGGQSNSHAHGPGGGGNWDGFTMWDQAGTGYWGVGAGPSHGVEGQTANANSDHSHGFSGTTSGMSADHHHYFSVPAFSGETGTFGVAGANANLPPYQNITFIIRLN